MRKLAALTAVTASLVGVQTFGIPIIQEGFETPGGLTGPGFYHWVGATDISGWTLFDDNDGERSYLVHEQRYQNIGLEFFDSQALILNEGSGIQTTVPLIAGEAYSFSVWGHGDWYLPLQITIGSLVTGIKFEHYSKGGLQERTFTFVAQETDEDAIFRIFNPDFGVNKDYRQRAIDNVSFSKVPDGGTSAGLLGLGLLSLALFRRRS
jgi:hypothetical protein